VAAAQTQNFTVVVSNDPGNRLETLGADPEADWYGSVSVWRNPVYASDGFDASVDNEEIGEQSGQCVTEVAGESECFWTLGFEGRGSLSLRGIWEYKLPRPPPDPLRLYPFDWTFLDAGEVAITGGTGDFEGAAGAARYWCLREEFDLPESWSCDYTFEWCSVSWDDAPLADGNATQNLTVLVSHLPDSLDKIVYTGPAGDSFGDLVVFRHKMFFPESFDESNEVGPYALVDGVEQGQCVIVSGNGNALEYECAWTDTFHGRGSMTAQGRVFRNASGADFFDFETFGGADFFEFGNLAITGGTGEFLGASGEVHVGCAEDPLRFCFYVFEWRSVFQDEIEDGL